MLLAINYPSWITPEVFPGIPFLNMLRWYGLMYIFAFGTAIFLFRKQVKEGALEESKRSVSEDDIYSFFMYAIVCLLLGARIFSTLVYDTSGVYIRKPWLIFWPFNEEGTFTGLSGMSYHGGVIGCLAGMIFWCLKNKRPLLKWIDVMSVSIPLGYTFGRIGNFLNGELYGRITTAPWGIVFPYAERFSASLEWVQKLAVQANVEISEGTVLVNFPRHPSQLYEAFFEGIILWAILWFLRKKKPFDGFLTGIYLCGYAIARFIIEYFREPDSDIGYRFATDPNAPLYFNTSLLNISTGQILSLFMFTGGLALILVLFIKSKKDLNIRA